MSEAQVFMALVACAGGLGTAIWYLIKRSDTRLDAERAERIRAGEVDRAMFLGLFERNQTAWMSSLEKEREAAKADRHEFRNELTRWGSALQNYKLEAAREYVNTQRLTEVMQPVRDSLDRIGESQSRIFEMLHMKQDKRGAGD